jgi:hypothetical protein
MYISLPFIIFALKERLTTIYILRAYSFYNLVLIAFI